MHVTRRFAREERTIVWVAEHDKLKREHRTPLTAENVEVLKRGQRAAANGDGWVFPSPDDPEKPIGRRETLHWWTDLENVGQAASHSPARVALVEAEVRRRQRRSTAGAVDGGWWLEVGSHDH